MRLGLVFDEQAASRLNVVEASMLIARLTDRLKEVRIVEQPNLEGALAKINAKLEILEHLINELQARHVELLKAREDIMARLKEPLPEVEKQPPMEKQIAYALDLTKRTGTSITESQLRGMSKAEVSKLIDKLRGKEVSK